MSNDDDSCLSLTQESVGTNEAEAAGLRTDLQGERGPSAAALCSLPPVRPCHLTSLQPSSPFLVLPLSCLPSPQVNPSSLMPALSSGQSFELEAKKKEYKKAGDSIVQKQTELSSLSNAKMLLQQTETSYLDAKKRSDDFAISFPTKSADWKKKMKDAADEVRSIAEEMSLDSSLLQTLSMNRKEVRTRRLLFFFVLFSSFSFQLY